MDLSSATTAITGSLSDVTTIALAVFGALGGMWGIRKIIKLVNRS